MRIKAHPTTYRGTRFRSRLEARWAAFFDLAGWRWQYEPGDYEGWSPDFTIIGDHAAIPVEVKPIEWPGDPQACRSIVLERPDLEKVRKQERPEILILGAYPMSWATDHGMSGPFLGMLWNEEWTQEWPDAKNKVDRAILWEGNGRALDFSASSNSYAYRVEGIADGDHHLKPISPTHIDLMWGKANELTQWRAH